MGPQRQMTDPLQDHVSWFEKLATKRARDHGLADVRCTESGVRARNGDLLFELTLDKDELVLALASRLRPDRYYAAEYVAVLLGDIGEEELAGHGRAMTASLRDPAAALPGPLRTTDWLLHWAQDNISRITARFCHEPHAVARLDAMVEHYLAGGTRPSPRNAPDGPRP